MATYADKADFDAYVEEGTVSYADADQLERVLERAERDLDRYVGEYWGHQENGLRFGLPKTTNEVGLDALQVSALTRATCAQAEFRLVMTEDFFQEDQFDSVSGPDFSTQGKRPRFGPKARDELRGTGLVVQSSGRAIIGGGLPSTPRRRLRI